MLVLRIVPGSSTPIYGQIVDQVAQAIHAGELAPGDALPSVRATAELLTVNVNTVVKAYAELEALGLIHGRQGRGFAVADKRPVFTAAERQRRLDEALDPVVAAAAKLGLKPAEVLAALKRKFDQGNHG